MCAKEGVELESLDDTGALKADSLDDFSGAAREDPPHTLTGLVVMVALLLRTSVFSSERASADHEIRAGLFSGCSVFLFYCSLQLQDGELTRPHPVVWRLVHGVTILYLVFVVYLVSQANPGSVDLTLQLVFESQSGSSPLPRDEVANVGNDCAATADNMYSKVDRFFLAHLVGWFVKALILRDWGMMWTCSILFEVMEVSLQKGISNFHECWWDRWLFDVFGCNLMGMTTGMEFASWIGARKYDWWGTKTRPSRTRKILDKLSIMPRSFPKRFEWHTFSSWRRFGISMLVVFVVMLGELNGFLLKSALQVPTEARVNLYRVLFMVPAVYASVVELYAYAEERTNRVGRTAWLLLSLGVLELILSVKNFWLRQAFSHHQLVPSRLVLWSWLATLTLIALVAVLKLFPASSSQTVHWVARLATLPFTVLLVADAWFLGGLAQACGFRGEDSHHLLV